MADLDGVKISKDYHVDVPFANQEGFYIKGANHLDWGMKKHLSNIFHPKSGNTVMFAFDHGYFMGSTAGLERLDLVIPKLLPYIDVLMGTRGALRSCVRPECGKGVALRVSSGSSMLNEDLSHEILAVDIEDAIRMNADCMAVQTFIGADGQLSSIENLSKAINLGMRYNIPTMGVVAVGKNMERTDKFFKLATRIVAEMGAHIIKTYYCDNFEEIVAACPVPIVVAGGKKLPERDAMTLAYNAIKGGAKGVDMGRNIFQSNHAVEMAEAIGKIVHEGFTDKEAYQFFEDKINETKI
ncbi:MAG: 3-hydroxy-5-phosphonooxypentane-2,4-dione thiolase [Eubacteriales bacterium]|nr:3-hydroxy-5-phosphonooxypentane-2,4-dione thiolase [Eubacteriales bacterium]